MVSHLLNVDEALAKKVAEGLGMKDMPTAAEPARPVKKDLPTSPALSIIRNGPEGFKGRKLGCWSAMGSMRPLLAALQEATAAEGATIEIVAPTVGGVTASDGKAIPAKQKINGGPSVLYDAIVVIPSARVRRCWPAKRDRPEELMQDLLRGQDLPTGIEPPRPISVTFIPATVFDNPALLRVNPEYLAWLLSLPTLERERLLGGNWKIRPRRAVFQTRNGVPSSTRSRPTSTSCVIGSRRR